MSYITTVRARLLDADPDRAREAHNGIVARLRPRGEPLGATTHMTFARADDPRDFLGLDGWSTLEGLQQFLGDPTVQQEMGSMFEGMPDVTVWVAREGWTTY
jgi:hypothetical protein